MCSYRTLQRNKHGYVVQCRACDSIEVAFGTTLISLSPKEFNEFVALTGSTCNSYKHYGHNMHKVVRLPTLSKHSMIICTVQELRDLRQLLLDAGNHLEMSKLFVFHDN